MWRFSRFARDRWLPHGSLPAVGALCWGLSAAVSAYAGCMGMELQAHRGAATTLPENSLASIQAALDGAWDGAEIDVQSLSDSELALHHDLNTTRTTTLRGRQVHQLSSNAWSEVLLKDSKGRITQERAPTLPQVLPAVAASGKVLNVEIKEEFRSCAAAHNVVRTLQLGLPNGQWAISAYTTKHLECVHDLDPHAYVGVVAIDGQSMASNNRRTASRASYVQTTVVTPEKLRELKERIRLPMGLHLDVYSLKANPNLMADAANLGIPIFTYSLKGDKFHASELRRYFREQQMLPSGAIIDGRPQDFCKDMAS